MDQDPYTFQQADSEGTDSTGNDRNTRANDKTNAMKNASQIASKSNGTASNKHLKVASQSKRLNDTRFDNRLSTETVIFIAITTENFFSISFYAFNLFVP